MQFSTNAIAKNLFYTKIANSGHSNHHQQILAEAKTKLHFKTMKQIAKFLLILSSCVMIFISFSNVKQSVNNLKVVLNCFFIFVSNIFFSLVLLFSC